MKMMPQYNFSFGSVLPKARHLATVSLACLAIGCSAERPDPCLALTAELASNETLTRTNGVRLEKLREVTNPYWSPERDRLEKACIPTSVTSRDEFNARYLECIRNIAIRAPAVHVASVRAVIDTPPPADGREASYSAWLKNVEPKIELARTQAEKQGALLLLERAALLQRKIQLITSGQCQWPT